MRQKLEDEVHELRSNIRRLQKMETIISEKDKSEKVVELKSKLQVTSSTSTCLVYLYVTVGTSFIWKNALSGQEKEVRFRCAHEKERG